MPDTESNEIDILDRVVGLVTRRRWWIILAASAVTFGAIAVLYGLPNYYNSEATILVVQQRVPERYVTPTSTTDIARSLDVMTQDVLSRTQLLSIIDELGLYPKRRLRAAPEQLIDMMRRDISIKPVESDASRRDVDALKISFTADNPHLAQAVSSKLTALFIQQNLKTREEQATSTTKFLHEQLEEARTKLVDHEQRLRDFKMKFLGELPEQQQGNLGILASFQSQLQNVSSSLSRAQQQDLYLESLLSQYQNLSRRTPGSLPGAVFSGQTGVPTSGPLELVQRDLERLQSEREQLFAKYTPNHPDVVSKNHQIARAQVLVDTLRASRTAQAEKAITPEGPPDAARLAPKLDERRSEPKENDAVVAQLKSQLEANRLEIENLQKNEQQLKTKASEYQARLNLTPVREQQLTSILRDYDLTKKNYADLLSKEQESQLAATLEKQQEGQQFRLVDPPSLPTIPSSPKRMKISLGAAGAGLLLGLVLAFLLETMDSSFHEETALIKRFALPLVIGIPLFVTTAEKRSRSLRRVLEWAGGVVLAVAVLTAEFYVYQHG